MSFTCLINGHAWRRHPSGYWACPTCRAINDRTPVSRGPALVIAASLVTVIVCIAWLLATGVVR